MKLDGNAVYYQLSQEFNDVVCETSLHSMTFDYPLLYDVSLDMSGHAVLVPEHERPTGGASMQQVLCVCVGDASTRAAKEAGLHVIQVHDAVAFQHLYNRMQALFVRNERIDARLRAYIDAHAGYQPLIDTCAESLGVSCALLDEQYSVVCAASAPQDEAARADGAEGAFPKGIGESAIDLFMASRNYRYMRESRKVIVMPDTENAFLRNVFSGSRVVGSLVMRHDGTVAHARYIRFLLNYLVPLIEEMYERIGTIGIETTDVSRVRQALQGALSGDAEDISSLIDLLDRKERETPASYVLLRLERSFTHEGPRGLGYAARRFERLLPHSHCVVSDGRLFALVETDAPRKARDRISLEGLSEVLRDNLLKAGMSRPFSDVRQIGAAQTQANAALEQGSAADPTYWSYRFEDYALKWLLSHGSGEAPLEHVCHPAIEELARFDYLNGADLLHTLFVFMSCRYNATLASKVLFVARSTLLNRIDRIVELTGIDLDDLEERIYLGASFVLTQGRIRTHPWSVMP